MQVTSKSEKQTLAFARRFAPKLQGGGVVALVGELGSGKTTFVRGLAAAFGVREPVRSPTFMLMHIHKLKTKNAKVKTLVHVDAYRLKNASELAGIGIEEYLGKKDTVVLIEWADRVRPLFRKTQGYRIDFAHGRQPNLRSITSTSYGA